MHEGIFLLAIFGISLLTSIFFGYNYITHFIWEIFTIFLLVVMFNIFVIFPRREKYPFLELLGFTFLGTAALEFAHAITYPGYIYNNPALSTEFWMFTRGFFLMGMVFTTLMYRAREKYFKTPKGVIYLPLIALAVIIFAEGLSHTRIFYSHDHIAPLKTAIEIIYTTVFFIIAFLMKKVPFVSLSAILSGVAELSFAWNTDFFSFKVILGHAFLVSSVFALVMVAAKEFVFTPFWQAEELAYRYNVDIKQLSETVQSQTQHLNEILDFRAELIRAENRKKLFEELSTFFTKHPEVNLAVFNKDRLLYKNLKMLPDVPFDYTGFERLDYRTVTIFLKVDDPFTKRLLHELLNDVAFKLLQIEDSEKIERLYSELKEVSNYRLTFMRSISHELKTPLNVIQGNLQLAKLGVYGDVSHLSELLEEIESAVKRATQLINNLLDLSRIETEGFYVKVEPVRFEMFKQIMKEYELLAQQKGLHFDFHFQGEEPFSGDFRIISTILSNLLSNAVKYTGCGEIKGFLQVRGDRIIIEVSDTESGIPLELQEKIFEPFVSGESGGSGLGLAIVKKFVDLLKGKITFTSNVGEGTTFHIEIPRVYRPSHYENKEHVNVLLVEPDESTRRLLRKIVSDYTVVEALTGQEGYLKALEHSPDLVITGLRLPDIGGDELLYRLRGEEALNRSKLMLYVSGKIQKTDTYLMGLEIDIGELASRLKILLGDKLLLGKTGGNPL